MGRGHEHTQFSPVAEIPYGDDITDAVEAFANANGLDYASYYHDLPVWIVRERNREPRVRQLQVVAYLVSRNPYISFIPSVHLSTERGKMKVPIQTLAHRFELKEFFRGRAFQERKFTEQLGTMWENSADLVYPEDQLMVVEVSEQTL